MDDVRPPKAERYNTDILKIPGVAFDVSVSDPKQRIQAYIDSYRTGSSELRQVLTTLVPCSDSKNRH